jgi:hypothetical protein
MLATVHFRIFLSSYVLSKNVKIKTTKLQFYLLFCMGMKLGLSHQGKNTLKVFRNGAEENICTEEGGSKRRHEKTA